MSLPNAHENTTEMGWPTTGPLGGFMAPKAFHPMPGPDMTTFDLDLAAAAVREYLSGDVPPVSINVETPSTLAWRFTDCVNEAVTYMHDTVDARNVVLLDRSARLAHIPLRALWRGRYPDEAMPDVYFMTPRGILLPGSNLAAASIIREELSENFVDEEAHDNIDLADEDATDFIERTRAAYQTPDESIERFQRYYKRLSMAGGEPTVIFDICTHTGEMLFLTSSLLRHAGLNNVSTAVIEERPYDPGLTSPDFAVTGEWAVGCHPMGEETGVEVTKGQLGITKESGYLKHLDIQAIGGQLRRTAAKYLAAYYPAAK